MSIDDNLVQEYLENERLRNISHVNRFDLPDRVKAEIIEVIEKHYE